LDQSTAGHQGNELADEFAKEAATNSDIEVCCDRIPKSAVKIELSENSETKWQIELDCTTKVLTTNLYFPKVADRLKLKIRVTPNFTMMMIGHGNIKTYSYLYKYKIIYSSICTCKIGEQTTDHLLSECDLVKQERDKIKAEILRTENWPVSKDTLINKYIKIFNKFVDSMLLENL